MVVFDLSVLRWRRERGRSAHAQWQSVFPSSVLGEGTQEKEQAMCLLCVRNVPKALGRQH